MEPNQLYDLLLRNPEMNSLVNRAQQDFNLDSLEIANGVSTFLTTLRIPHRIKRIYNENCLVVVPEFNSTVQKSSHDVVEVCDDLIVDFRAYPIVSFKNEYVRTLDNLNQEYSVQTIL